MAVVGPTAADLQSMNNNYYIALISITILVYDFILTFPAEVERFWFVGRVNCALCLFYVNRYLVPFGYVPILIEYFWVNDEPTKLKICRDLQAFHEIFSAVVQVIIGAALIMRIYALYGRDVRVIVFLVITSAILLAVGCWAGFGGSDPMVEVGHDVLVNVGCGIFRSSYRARRLALTWGLTFLFDLTIFGMTLYRNLTFHRSNNANTLIAVLMRDGAVYFGVVTACNLMNILFLLLGDPLTRASSVMLSNALCSLMITRLILNLRDPSFILVSENASENTAYPDLTIVESHYPTQISYRDGFAESESRVRDETSAADVDPADRA